MGRHTAMSQVLVNMISTRVAKGLAFIAEPLAFARVIRWRSRCRMRTLPRLYRHGVGLGSFFLFLIGVGSCGGTSVPPPPVAPTLTGINFTWRLSAPLPKLPQCATHGARPCLRYSLRENGKEIASPSIHVLSYLLKPIPATGTHTYVMMLQVESVHNDYTNAKVPALKVVYVPRHK